MSRTVSLGKETSTLALYIKDIHLVIFFCWESWSFPCTALTQCYSLESLCRYDTIDGTILSCPDGTHLVDKCTHYACHEQYECLQSYCIPTRKFVKVLWTVLEAVI